jgi:CheY-like chemotaxis protein
MNLPDMNGVEVFKRLRQDPRARDIPVVAVSADALPDHVQHVLQLGFDGYWTKPLDLVVTIGKLKQILAQLRR